MSLPVTSTASLDDVPAIRALLARAYFDDPLSRWIFPDPELRADACAAWYGLFVEQYVRGARATVVRDGTTPVAVALWRLPRDRPLSSDGVPSIAGLLAALVGRERASVIGDGLHAIASVIPDEPYVYLNFLAVLPARQRTGLGRLVLGPLFAAASESGLFIHLETANPANHAFYERLGFVETGRMTIGSDGPELRALRYPPA